MIDVIFLNDKILRLKRAMALVGGDVVERARYEGAIETLEGLKAYLLRENREKTAAVRRSLMAGVNSESWR